MARTIIGFHLSTYIRRKSEEFLSSDLIIMTHPIFNSDIWSLDNTIDFSSWDILIPDKVFERVKIQVFG